MPQWTIAFLIGACSIYYLSYLPSLNIILIIFFLALLSYGLAILYKFYFLQLISIGLLGFIWIVIHAHGQLAGQLPVAWEGKLLQAKGWIITIPNQINHHWRFTMELIEVNKQRLAKPMRVQLHWYPLTPMELSIGDQWQLALRLKRPFANRNPGSNDLEAQWFTQGIKATGYVVAKGQYVYLGNSFAKAPIDKIRQSLNQAIKQALHNTAYTGLITALSIGIVADITAQQWQVLRNTNTNHLMAISGLHIGLSAGIALVLINAVWRRFPRLILYIPAQQIAAIVALVVAILYSALAGFAIPTQRALIMLAIFLSATLWHRNLTMGRAWFTALGVTLLYNPLAILAHSFWLSYSAVGILIFGMACRLDPKNFWWRWGRTQWVVALGLMPFLLLFFQQVSFAGFIANSIAIPWVSFIVVPTSLLGTLLLPINFSLGQIILLLATRCLDWLWRFLAYLAAIPQLQWQHPLGESWLFLTFSVATILAVAPKGWPGRWLSAIWTLPLILHKPAVPGFAEVRFTLLDVGQGLSAVVQTQQHGLVYDTGAKLSPNFDMGHAVLLPYLHTLGITKIDKLIISHPDNDHSGGVGSVMAGIQVMQFFTSAPNYFAQYHPHICRAGQAWSWDGVQFEFLHPPANLMKLGNDQSCVLRISLPGHSILLPGDIESKAEKYLLQTRDKKLPSEILVAPHHGSRTSSTMNFIQQVFPDYVLFAVGYRNRYHHPNPKVVIRYLTIGAQLYDSPHCGAISFHLRPNQVLLPPECYRQTDKHIWNTSVISKTVNPL